MYNEEKGTCFYLYRNNNNLLCIRHQSNLLLTLLFTNIRNDEFIKFISGSKDSLKSNL